MSRGAFGVTNIFFLQRKLMSIQITCTIHAHVRIMSQVIFFEFLNDSLYSLLLIEFEKDWTPCTMWLRISLTTIIRTKDGDCPYWIKIKGLSG